MIWALAALLVAVLVAALALGPMAELRRRPVTAADRNAGAGAQVALSQGITHYRWFGPSRGPVAVCIHGLTTPSYVWVPIAEGLALRGYRVLTYDLYGRGLSDRPGGRQDAAFFLRQLDDLLGALDVAGNLKVLGYSMGGMIASRFAEARPDRVDRLILIAPAGLGLVVGRLARLTRDTPFLGGWLMRVIGARMMRRGIDRSLSVSAMVPDIAERQAAEFDRRGTLPAVLSSQRHMLAEDQAALHHRLAETGLPILAVWGEEDKAVPLSALGRLAQANRAARQVALPGAGHGLPYTHPREILAAVFAFLQGR